MLFSNRVHLKLNCVCLTLYRVVSTLNCLVLIFSVQHHESVYELCFINIVKLPCLTCHISFNLVHNQSTKNRFRKCAKTALSLLPLVFDTAVNTTPIFYSGVITQGFRGSSRWMGEALQRPGRDGCGATVAWLLLKCTAD